jgi:hypothetical protein
MGLWFTSIKNGRMKWMITPLFYELLGFAEKCLSSALNGGQCNIEKILMHQYRG